VVNTRKGNYQARLAEYRKHLLAAFGEREFLPEDGSKVLGTSLSRGSLYEFWQRLIKNGVVFRIYKDRPNTRRKITLCCVPKPSGPIVQTFVKYDKDRLANDEHADVLRKKFGVVPFSLPQAAEALERSESTASAVVRSLRQRQLLRRGVQPQWGGGRRVLYAFLTPEQLATGQSYDWEEPMDDDDPTDGNVEYGVQLFGDDLERYKELHYQRLKDPRLPREKSFGKTLINQISSPFRR
jgi:hypothetical protein